MGVASDGDTRVAGGGEVRGWPGVGGALVAEPGFSVVVGVRGLPAGRGCRGHGGEFSVARGGCRGRSGEIPLSVGCGLPRQCAKVAGVAAALKGRDSGGWERSCEFFRYGFGSSE